MSDDEEIPQRRDRAVIAADTQRVALALGPGPRENARHLLAPISLPPMRESSVVNGPHPGTEFIVKVSGDSRRTAAEIRAVFDGLIHSRWGFPPIWATVPGRDGLPRTEPLARVADFAPVASLVFSRELAGVLEPDPRRTAADLTAFLEEVNALSRRLGWQASARESPADAALRAGRLAALKQRFAHSVELRLLASGLRFPARDVWRAADALGLEWGQFDLFHWHNPGGERRRLWTLGATGSGGGSSGLFLPERAAEGETVPGLALSFELPTNPVPLETYDRMAVALDYLRQKLGGRPTAASDGAELDGERLWNDRDALFRAVEAMTEAGIPTGSPEASRFF